MSAQWHRANFDGAALKKETDLTCLVGDRVARHCVCCGSSALRSSPAIMMPFISDRVFGWKPTRVEAEWGLRTIEPGMAYALCNSLLCEACGLLFMDLRFSENEMARLYRNYRGEEYTQLRDFYEPGYASRNQELAHRLGYIGSTEEFLGGFVKNKPCILDWGGDTGVNTPLKGIAREIEIYDISEKLTDGGDSVTNKLRLKSKTYDLITCCNVLEHVPHPALVLKEIKEYSHETTIFFIEVPHETLRIECPNDAVVFQKRHWHEHINFYSESSLRSLISKCGFRLLALRSCATNEKGNQAQVFQLVFKKI
jgi:hypothetical protein